MIVIDYLIIISLLKESIGVYKRQSLYRGISLQHTITNKTDHKYKQTKQKHTKATFTRLRIQIAEIKAWRFEIEAAEIGSLFQKLIMSTKSICYSERYRDVQVRITLKIKLWNFYLKRNLLILETFSPWNIFRLYGIGRCS